LTHPCKMLKQRRRVMRPSDNWRQGRDRSIQTRKSTLSKKKTIRRGSSPARARERISFLWAKLKAERAPSRWSPAGRPWGELVKRRADSPDKGKQRLLFLSNQRWPAQKKKRVNITEDKGQCATAEVVLSKMVVSQKAREERRARRGGKSILVQGGGRFFRKRKK